ncbi:MAG: glycoside hydrolase family 2 protein [Bacteroidota bacterium]|nr:glycoside hydrolase family 2 protein [Bacteroidota bacterium]
MSRWFGAFLVLSLVSCGTSHPSPVDLGQLEWTLSCRSGRVNHLSADIPGHVLPALTKAGLAPDPNHGTNERDVQWIEDDHWTYSTTVPTTALAGMDSAVLIFKGLDTYAHVSVNGSLVLSTDNAHRSWTTPPFACSDDSLTLSITFDPVATRGSALLDKHGMLVPASNEAKPVGQQTSPMTRKPGYQFGWDWGPRLAGPGISGHVLLRPWSAHSTTAPEPPICAVVQADSQLARIDIKRRDGWSLNITHEGRTVPWDWVGSEVHLAKPELWWPVGMGDQPLYHWTWTHSKTGFQLQFNMGMRTLDWIEQDDDFGTSFKLEVNGHPVFARGANVVPPDFHDTQNPDRWTKVVTQALDANMNMMRVWGGGVYPPDAFFEACDAAGILVWQDFMFACAMVPDDPEFHVNVRQEALEQVRRLRHHPSLALWCGNNEVERAWASWGWQDMYDLHGPDSVRLADAYHRLFHEVLPNIVADESDLHYLPTSPTLDARSGDEHAWGVWFGLEDFDYYSRHGGRFASEYGLQSLPCKHTLHDAGITSWDDESLQFRQRSRMDWLEPGFDGWDMMHHFMSKTTGAPKQGDLDDWIFKSQWTQAEGIRQALERHRTSSGKYDGSLYWSLNDVWPAVSWSTVDHAGRWKLAHHAVRRANAPRTALWVRHREDSLCFEVFNDLPEPASGVIEVALKDFTGQVLRQVKLPFQLNGRHSKVLPLGDIAPWRTRPFDTYLSWQWTDASGTLQARSSALWCAPIDANLPDPKVRCIDTSEGYEVSAEAYAPLVRLLASVPGRWSDNGMSLEPGRPVTVKFRAETEANSEFDVEVQSLVKSTQ